MKTEISLNIKDKYKPISVKFPIRVCPCSMSKFGQDGVLCSDINCNECLHNPYSTARINIYDDTMDSLVYAVSALNKIKPNCAHSHEPQYSIDKEV